MSVTIGITGLHSKEINKHEHIGSDSDIRGRAGSDSGAGRLHRAPQGARPGLEGSPGGGRQVEGSPQVDIGNPPRT